MLLGEVVYKMGQKHRLALPKKFREVMGDQLVITRGYEGCLVIVSEQEWLPLVAAVDQASFLDVNARASARFLLGGASQISLDGQGRFVVPDVLFAHADLNEEVVFVGLGKWVEVWDRAKWEVLQQQLAEQGSDIAQRLISSKEDSQA